MDSIDASDDIVPAMDEDSVDIYADLDIRINNSANVPSSGTSELKESLNIYEDILAEELHSRESTFTELKSRFQSAQNQIKELCRRLEQVEVKNSALSTENNHLKKNISALLRTARQEVMRKDAEILRLTQWAEKRHHPHTFREADTSTINKLQPPIPTSSQPGGHLSFAGPPESTGKENCSLTRSTKASTERRSRRETEVIQKLAETDKHTSRRKEDKYQRLKSTESMDKRIVNCSNTSKDSHAAEEKQSHKDSGKRCEYRSHKSGKYSDVHRDCRSDGASTSLQENSRRRGSSDHKQEGSREKRSERAVTSSEYDTFKSTSFNVRCSPESKRIKLDRYGKSSKSQDKKICPGAEHSDMNKEKKRDRQDVQRKRDKVCETAIDRKKRRSSQSETLTEQEKQKPMGTDKSKENPCCEERREMKPKAVGRSSSSDAKEGANGSLSENRSNQKLSFMETLNLTLSPIKKQVEMSKIPHGSQSETPLVYVDVANKSAEDYSQNNMAEMCVIDELDCTECETDSGAGAEGVQTLWKHKNVDLKDATANKTLTESPSRSMAIQSTSTPNQSPDSGINQPLRGQKTGTLEGLDDKKQLDKNAQDSNGHINKHILEVTGGAHPTKMPEIKSSNCTEPQTQHAESVESDSPATDSAVMDSSKTTEPERVSQDSNRSTTGPPHTPVVAKDVTRKSCDKRKINEVTPIMCEQDHSIQSSTAIDHPGKNKGSKDATSVASTVGVESLQQDCLSLTEAIFIITQADEDTSAGNSVTSQSISSAGCAGVSKLTSTAEGFQNNTVFTVTPKKVFSPARYQERMELSGSAALPHDEDSMMRTLSNLKRIPDAISPLRSPVRTAKRNMVQGLGKPGHVKSLQRDFLTTAVDGGSKKVDVNKENKHPGSPANCDTQHLANVVSERSSSLSDTELEEGEILSENDDVVTSSPAPRTKRASLAEPVKTKPSVLRRKSEEKQLSPIDTSGGSSQSPKSRFKVVCPAASKAPFTTIEEIMETFKQVRAEIRKKYMKLHKTFPKKSFYGVMDNFQKSFLEFVDGAHFSQISNQTGELKSKLKKHIVAVFNKVLNNGIVKRIFEQQAFDLKQKLWDFVDVQIDYLLKEIDTTLKSLCKPTRPPVKEKRSRRKGKESSQDSTNVSESKQQESYPAHSNPKQTVTALVPYRTGLGSRGKDIRITQLTDKDSSATAHPPACRDTQTTANVLSRDKLLTPEKNKMSNLVQNSNILDKADFQLLTEQQASSLTFNLARDSQMGEIFKCLLQGDDLNSESNVMAGDHTAWSIDTPRKNGDSFTPSLSSPSKFYSSKLIATWCSISPHSKSSPRAKEHLTVHPALFDESCLLEVPSESCSAVQSSFATHKSYSVLAEDLAVSLTIPSPLKSDSHLSFLHSASVGVQKVSTPGSVLSAHISEDALIDGEDATEQDIHLALDTDHSSCSSSTSAEIPVFKPEVPMQALVMEKSNDHFIVKIRQVNKDLDVTLIPDESLNHTLTEGSNQQREDIRAVSDGHAGFTSSTPAEICPNSAQLPENDHSTQKFFGHGESEEQSIAARNSLPDLTKETSPSKHVSEVCSSKESGKTSENSPEDIFSNISPVSSNRSLMDTNSTNRTQVTKGKNNLKASLSGHEQTNTSCTATVSDICLQKTTNCTQTHQDGQAPHFPDLNKDDIYVSESERSLTIDTSSSPEKAPRSCQKARKRKKHQDEQKSKKFKKEKGENPKKFTTSKMTNNEPDSSPPSSMSPSSLSPSSLSPSSLSAKNIIRKKGEVVMSWTRDEDRAILMSLKTKGASRKTFAVLSEKLNKPSSQIADRFNQLMKLFKKQKM